MRPALLTVAVLWSGTLWCQVERDCKAPKSAAEQVICSNPRVKAWDEAFEKKLEEVNQEASTWDPFIDGRLHAMWDREVVACLQKEDCIRAVYSRRLEFLKNLRIAARRDRGPADMRAELAQLNAAELTKQTSMRR